MREAIRDIDRLRHIDECIEHINDYLREKSLEDMKADKMCLTHCFFISHLMRTKELF